MTLFVTFLAYAALAVAPTASHYTLSPELGSSLNALGFADLELELTKYSVDLKRSEASGNNSCAAACNILHRVLPSGVVSFNGSSSYEQQESRYWSNQQAETFPACRVQPYAARGVAAALLVSRHLNCQFAVKSGGHAAFTGASNIQNGITIDLAALNEVEVEADRLTTRVGAGNRWVDVYEKLTPMNLSVIGGRVADIGVGGLTLGGGISFFSGRYGWACDNVVNYQVVLANSSIVNVNYQSHPSLYYALRGGGNNFGIVTRFDLNTFEQGAIWGGAVTYNISANASIYSAFENFSNNALQDPDAALWTATFFYEGSFGISNEYIYAKPVASPPIFSQFAAIPSVFPATQITNMTAQAILLNASNPGGFRETYTTATFKNNATLQGKILDIFVSEIKGISNATGLLPALIMQPITADMASHFSKKGGNALGIAESDCPLILMNLAIMWSSPADDARIHAAAKRIIDHSVTTAQAMGLDYKYIYQNYASADQDVFAGYGQENLQRLRRISQAVDPDRVFQRLQPGYFKLGA